MNSDENPNKEAPDLPTQTTDIRDVSFIDGAWVNESNRPLRDGDTIASESGQFTLRVRNYQPHGGIDIYFEHTPFRGDPRSGTVLPDTYVTLDVNITSSSEEDSLTVQSLNPTRITLTLTKKGNK